MVGFCNTCYANWQHNLRRLLSQKNPALAGFFFDRRSSMRGMHSNGNRRYYSSDYQQYIEDQHYNH